MSCSPLTTVSNLLVHLAPLRYLQTDSSWILKADGTCVIDIFFRDGFASDVASLSEISRAAKIVDNACVARGSNRVQGGWIRDIGMLISLSIPNLCTQTFTFLPVNMSLVTMSLQELRMIPHMLQLWVDIDF